MNMGAASRDIMFQTYRTLWAPPRMKWGVSAAQNTLPTVLNTCNGIAVIELLQIIKIVLSYSFLECSEMYYTIFTCSLAPVSRSHKNILLHSVPTAALLPNNLVVAV